MFEQIKKRRWDLWLKAAVVALLLATLYREIWLREGLSAIWKAFGAGMRPERWILAFVMMVLMPLNWLLESLKWRQFLHRSPPVSLRRAVAAVLAGLSLSFVTPHRLGDYGGRAMAAPTGRRGRALWATALSGFCQLVVTLLMGSMGLLLMGRQYWPAQMPAGVGPWLIVLPLGVLTGVLLAPRLLGRMANRFSRPALRRLARRAAGLSHVPAPTLLAGLGLAALRYGVYAGQYLLMLRFFGVEAPLPAAVGGVATIFLIQTSLPLPPLAALLARGEIALLIWGPFQANEISILAATFAVFIINIALPALLGLFFIVQFDVKKSLGYEKYPD